MFKVDIKVTGLTEAVKSLDTLARSIDGRMSQLGEETVTFMRNTIKNSAKRGSTGRLGNAIKKYPENGVSVTGTIHWVGVGKIDELPPYWEVVNYGGYRPPTTGKYVPLGAFPDGAPVASKSGGTWLVGAGPYTFLDNKIKRPIRPMNYLESTLTFVSTYWSAYFTVGSLQASGIMTGRGLGRGGITLGK